MPSFIICLKDGRKKWFLEWSTIVDAPTSKGMKYDEFCEWYVERYGTASRSDLYERMERAKTRGTSSMVGDTVESLIAGNRAGPNEKTLTLQQIIDRYCKEGGADSDASEEPPRHDIMSALDLLNDVRFKRGRAPTGNDGMYIHDVWNRCERHVQTVAALGDAVPLNAIAEAVRLGVLVAEVWK